MTPLPSPHTAAVTLRVARPDDAPEVARLAALDSRRPLVGPVLLAEEGGVPRAALSLADGAVVADPFAPTAHLVALLRRHADRRTAPPGWSRGDAERVRSRLPRLALRAGQRGTVSAPLRLAWAERRGLSLSGGLMDR